MIYGCWYAKKCSKIFVPSFWIVSKPVVMKLSGIKLQLSNKKATVIMKNKYQESKTHENNFIYNNIKRWNKIYHNWNKHIVQYLHIIGSLKQNTGDSRKNSRGSHQSQSKFYKKKKKYAQNTHIVRWFGPNHLISDNE